MNLEKFNSFKKEKVKQKEEIKEIWGYTRVSSKQQLSNYSLEDQNGGIENYFDGINEFHIEKYLGGTYESASGDFTRKEFMNLIDEVKRAKKKPYAIAIHYISRFSRTGGSAISIVEDLVTNMGVHLIETSSGLTTANESDRVKIWKKLIEAREENIQRLERTLPGMKSLLKDGNWLGSAPKGYTMKGRKVSNYANVQDKQEIVINEDGEKLRKAWLWKSNGERDFVIMQRLNKLGLIVTKQWLSQMWRNPFYCGISVNSLLDSPVKGNWQPLVNENDFLSINGKLTETKPTYKKSDINENRPLTGFLKCADCQRPLTSYEVKAKHAHYYKCQTCKGVSLNCMSSVKSLKEGVNDSFAQLLQRYSLSETLTEPFKLQLMKQFKNMNAEAAEELVMLRKQEKELQAKADNLERRFVEDGLLPNLYEKYSTEYESKLVAIRTDITLTEKRISNHGEFIDKAIKVAVNLSKYWVTQGLEQKLRIQKMVFPEGLMISHKNRQYLTTKVNRIFELTSTFIGDSDEVESKKPTDNVDGSCLVAGTGLEPVTFGL